MAKVPAFLEVLSGLDGRKRETFVEMALVLRRAGQLPPTKRGLGSNAVDSFMAANFLIAALSDAGPAACPRAVEVYRSLRPRRSGGAGRTVPGLHAVASCATFGEAVEALIERGPQIKADVLRVLGLVYPDVPKDRSLELGAVQIELSVQRPIPYARLSMKVANEVGLHIEEFSAEWTVDMSLVDAGFYRPEMIAAQADKRSVSTIGHRAIFELSELIAEQPAAVAA
ncbi:hypothetical protein [Microvirga aerophila]|uniref:hypothetical protein n=1 Tax=Microvirga aerophila TaxID=670291 RepID=UPI0011BF25C0|nr:hypothetical protein [Microvirga aerophila]